MTIYPKENNPLNEFESNTITNHLKENLDNQILEKVEEKEDSPEQPQEDPPEQPQEDSPEQPQEDSPEQPQEDSPEQPQEDPRKSQKREPSHNNLCSQNKTESEPPSPERICRICYDDQKEEKLISPCKCSGSVQWVHHSCLQKWIDISRKNECSTCKYTYQYQKKYKRDFYKHLDHTYIPKILTIVFILITTILSGLISKLMMNILKFNTEIRIGLNIKYLFFSLKYFSLLFFISLPILHYFKIINIREIYTNYISLYERNNTVYGQGVSDISIFIYLTIYKFFEKNINKLTQSEKVIMEYIPEKKNN